MSLVRTTLASAVAVTDTKIVVASASGFAAGSIVKCDEEVFKIAKNYDGSSVTVPVLRGQDGTRVVAHASGAGVVAGVGSDWSTPAPQTVDQYPIAGRARTVTSYTADGAITLPTPGSDALAILNGTSQWDMTLANPTKDMDGCILTILGNGKAAHTVTYAAGLGNASTGYTVLTFDTGGQCCVQLIAANEIWVPLPSPFSGTLTAIDVAVA